MHNLGLTKPVHCVTLSASSEPAPSISLKAGSEQSEGVLPPRLRVSWPRFFAEFILSKVEGPQNDISRGTGFIKGTKFHGAQFRSSCLGALVVPSIPAPQSATRSMRMSSMTTAALPRMEKNTSQEPRPLREEAATSATDGHGWTRVTAYERQAGHSRR